ncbi:hypothetical protein FB567DRAFT_548626 [Paraphoma chrysanthemicola]|uniref:CRIB domain-containing protein n=1 Tax=Paraphoma chrysanthemicola TaxID=798071 RepID=A0A8K0R5N4_9PLEO|nr:hypothetical protein FB567DRAFT_548626 [Paraphoma chrysanthemicola]
MFASHKSDAAPQSTQLSVDDPVYPALAASPSEPRISQCLDDSTNGIMHSPEQRYKAHSSKRASVFNLRARSNTTTSTNSSYTIHNPIDMAFAEASRPASPFVIHNGPHGAVEQSSYRKSLFRGKKGKRLSESVSSSILVTEFQEMDFGDKKRTSVLRKAKKRNNVSEVPSHGLKHIISSPFGFQHLTHTDRYHSTAFAPTAGDKLGPGFREVVPSPQKPDKVPLATSSVDLHFDNFSSDNLLASEHRSPTSASFGSPPQSPHKVHELHQSDATPLEQAFRPTLRLARSVESFSQPGVPPRSHRHSQSVLAPPRLSSLPSLASIDDVPEDLPPQTRGTTLSGRSRSNRESGVWDSFSLATAYAEPHLPGIRDDSVYFGHALTTPDDSAIQAMTPPFSPSLDDVAEEPERFVRPRPAPAPPMRSPSTPKSPNFDHTIFNHQRSPNPKNRSRGNSRASPRSYSQRTQTSRPVSQMSETLGSTELVRRTSVRRPSANRRKSNTWRMLEGSWEDDIDYIYDHALEADCDFEWDRASDDETNESMHRSKSGHRGNLGASAQLQAPFDPEPQQQAQEFRASLLVPSAMGTPDLEPTSATSASTMETALRTPSDLFHRNSNNSMGGFIDPSLLVPQDYKEDREHTYEDLLNDYEDSDRHFPMLDPRHSSTSSARSRRSSYDSSLISSAQNSGLWSSPVRRSASSAGSVPDLVPSRRVRRDLSFSLVIDQMSESVASLSHLDEEKEDEDITPPGRAVENRTFFPSDDEDKEPVTQGISIEEELRSSLEAARHGSQRVDSEQEPSADVARNNSQRSINAHPRHRKQALSDGAAKLPAQTTSTEAQQTRPRNRAATTSARSPMLSLFPSPPRNSPTPTSM